PADHAFGTLLRNHRIGHDGDKQRSTHGTGNLAHRVVHRSTVRHQFFGHLVQTGSRHRHHDHGHAEHPECVDYSKICECRFSIQCCEHQGGYRNDGKTDDGKPSCAIFIEEPSGNRTHYTHDDRAGEQHHAGCHCREREHVLHQYPQYDRSTDHRHEDNHAELRRQCEIPILEHGKFQYRLFETVLAPDENVQCRRTENERYDDCRDQPSAVAGHTESVEQSDETECRQYNRDYIELRIRLFSDIP